MPGNRAAIRPLLDVGMVFSGRLGGVLLNLLFLPLYDALLGPELFGVVAVILSLLSFFMVFDFGAATLVATDVAASRHNDTARAAAGRDWRRSEMIIVAVAIIGMLVVLVFDAIGDFETFGPVDVMLASLLVGTMVLLNVGQAALNGLQAYRLNNGLMLAGTIARGLVTLLFLREIEASLTAFLAAQLLVAVLHFAVLRGIVSKRLSSGRDALFERGAALRVWSRMRPLIGYTLAGALVMQVDKPIVAGFFSLELAGRWFLATTYALVPIAVLAGPLNQYFYPKLVAAQANPSGALVVGRRFQVAVSLAVTAPTVILVYFAPEVLALWLPHADDIGVIAPIAQLLVVAAAIGATGFLPTAWLLATGDRAWLARLSICATLAVILLLPLAGFRQDIMLVAGIYAAYHVLVCLLLWIRMLRSWPGRSAGAELALNCWIGPAVLAGAGTVLLSGAASGFSVAGWVQILVASTGGAIASLLVAWLWWFRYSTPPASSRRR